MCTCRFLCSDSLHSLNAVLTCRDFRLVVICGAGLAAKGMRSKKEARDEGRKQRGKGSQPETVNVMHR